MIMDHYLAINRWRPDFRPSREVILSAAVWVRLSELPLEYYDEEILPDMARLIGKPIGLDKNTVLAMRGKYARLCIEVDFDKPLVPLYALGNFDQRVEYEGLHNICFRCGIVGHRSDSCAMAFQQPSQSVTITDSGGGDVNIRNFPARMEVLPVEHVTNTMFSPWLVATRRARRPIPKRTIGDKTKEKEGKVQVFLSLGVRCGRRK